MTSHVPRNKQAHSLLSRLVLLILVTAPSVAHSYELPPHPYPQTVLQVRTKLADDPATKKRLTAYLLKASNMAASASNGTRKDDLLVRISRELAVLGSTRSAISTAHLIVNTSRQNHAISSIAEIMVQTNDVHSAVKLAQLVKDHRARDSILFSIIREQINQGYLDEAHLTISSITKSGDRVLLLIWMAAGFLKAGNRDAARAQLQEALATTPQLPLQWDKTGSIPKEEALVKIAEMQAEAGDWSIALQTANSINISNLKAWAITEIAVRQGLSGDISSALSTVNLIEETDYRSDARFQIAGALTNAKKHAESINVLTENLTDERATNQALTLIAKNQAETGEDEAALKTIDLIDSNRSSRIPGYGNAESGRSEIISQIIRSKARSGDFTGAKNSVADLSVLRRWLALEEIGRIQGGEEGINLVKQAAEHAPSLSKVCVFELLAIMQDKMGHHDEAVRSANTAKKIIDDFTERDFRSGLDPSLVTSQLVTLNKRGHYGELSEVQARISDLDGALRTVALIDDKIVRGNAIASIAFVLGYHRKPSSSLDKVSASRPALDVSYAIVGYVMGAVEVLGSKNEPLSPLGTHFCHFHYQ